MDVITIIDIKGTEDFPYPKIMERYGIERETGEILFSSQFFDHQRWHYPHQFDQCQLKEILDEVFNKEEKLIKEDFKRNEKLNEIKYEKNEDKIEQKLEEEE